MRAELYWIEGPWPSQLAILPRPRGGEWLEDEIRSQLRKDTLRAVPSGPHKAPEQTTATARSHTRARFATSVRLDGVPLATDILPVGVGCAVPSLFLLCHQFRR
jgi:hypothetical protein